MGKCMLNSREITKPRTSQAPRMRQSFWALAALLACLAISGCQAVTNPVLDGSAASAARDPAARDTLKTFRCRCPAKRPQITWSIPETSWQSTSRHTSQGRPAPINMPQATSGAGYAFPRWHPRDRALDGTSCLNLRAGERQTLAQIQTREDEYLNQQIVKPDATVLITLFKKRTYHVLVVRQDSTSNQSNATGGVFGVGAIGQAIGVSGRGTGVALDLPAYENDVMNALTRSGGLPGFDAADEVLIERGDYRRNVGPADAPDSVDETLSDDVASLNRSEFGGRVTRIPLRLPAGQEPAFDPKDIILKDGDIVYIATRNAEVFYTGGLLFTGNISCARL